jgi:hypothetical protein
MVNVLNISDERIINEILRMTQQNELFLGLFLRKEPIADGECVCDREERKRRTA